MFHNYIKLLCEDSTISDVTSNALKTVTLTSLIKEKAKELGFDLVGISNAAKPIGGDHLNDWLRRGYHAGMDWIDRTFVKRINPDKVLPGAKTIISVALNYYTGNALNMNNGTRNPNNDTASINSISGRISIYALGDDYHKIMKSRLKKLAAFLSLQVTGCKVKFYVDTGPVLEKAWAQNGGMGWIGKHTNLISRTFGSWIFLGEILTDVELCYDKPHKNFCGSCRECIKACPTKAIVEPYTLDSSKCVSYLTIEHAGEIPFELGKKIGKWIYGCDICQEVCPWNRFAKATRESVFQPRSGFNAPNLFLWKTMTKEEFQVFFKGSAMKRLKHERFFRNINVALENVI